MIRPTICGPDNRLTFNREELFLGSTNIKCALCQENYILSMLNSIHYI